MADWHPFDYEDKKNTAPPADDLVWVVEVMYDIGVTLGVFDGVTFRLWYGTDDCEVTHWSEIEYPDGPS